MKIGIFTDTHLGFGSDERFEEAFDRVKESLTLLREQKVDYIVHAGDLFDMPVPEPEVWRAAFDAFSVNNTRETLITKHTLTGTEEVLVRGIPIIAIYGNHEYRTKDFANTLSIMEKAGVLASLHGGHVILEKNGEKVAIHGMGSVPEKNAKMVLEKYSPQAIDGASNILLLHQSFKDLLPFDDDDLMSSLSFTDLPDGFDIIINGHLHWRAEHTFEGKRFLLAGSTVTTQMKKLEAGMLKGVYVFDTITKQLTFTQFKNQRTLFYEKIKFTDAKPEEVVKVVQEKIAKIAEQQFVLRPMVRIKLVGTLAKGFTQSDISLTLPDFAIFSVSKHFTVESFQKKIEGLKELQTQKKSILEMGVDILEKNVDEAQMLNFPTRRVFDLLAVGQNEAVEEVLLMVEK